MRSGQSQAARSLLVQTVDKKRPEAMVAFHRIQHTDPDTLSGLYSQTRWLVYDEDLVIAVQEWNHGAKAYASVPM